GIEFLRFRDRTIDFQRDLKDWSQGTSPGGDASDGSVASAGGGSSGNENTGTSSTGATITGTNASEYLRGTGGRGVSFGGDGGDADNKLQGGPGNDILQGALGNDKIYADCNYSDQGGNDTAILSYTFGSGYTVSGTPNALHIVGAEDDDWYYNVENFQFANGV